MTEPVCEPAPAEAVTAAIEALHRNRSSCDGGNGIICEPWHHRDACNALGAAAPLIAAAECERIRNGAEDLKFTLFRNGPAQGQALDVVPLAELLKLIGGDDG